MNNKTPFLELEDKVLLELFQAAQMITHSIKSDTSRDSDVTATWCLILLATQPYISMKELAESLNLAISSTTALIDRMIERGHVTRSPDKHDRRIVRIGLTPQGEQYFNQISSKKREKFNRIFQIINKKDLDIFYRVLCILTTEIREIVKNSQEQQNSKKV